MEVVVEMICICRISYIKMSMWVPIALASLVSGFKLCKLLDMGSLMPVLTVDQTWRLSGVLSWLSIGHICKWTCRTSVIWERATIWKHLNVLQAIGKKEISHLHTHCNSPYKSLNTTNYRFHSNLRRGKIQLRVKKVICVGDGTVHFVGWHNAV